MKNEIKAEAAPVKALEQVRIRELEHLLIEGDGQRAALLSALNMCLLPLIRLGDFIGNEDKGGASGLGAFNRCEIISSVRAAIALAEGVGK